MSSTSEKKNGNRKKTSNIRDLSRLYTPSCRSRVRNGVAFRNILLVAPCVSAFSEWRVDRKAYWPATRVLSKASLLFCHCAVVLHFIFQEQCITEHFFFPLSHFCHIFLSLLKQESIFLCFATIVCFPVFYFIKWSQKADLGSLDFPPRGWWRNCQKLWASCSVWWLEKHILFWYFPRDLTRRGDETLQRSKLKLEIRQSLAICCLLTNLP